MPAAKLWVVIALVTVLVTACRRAPEPRVGAQLAADIAAIKAIDHHAHPVRPTVTGQAPDTDHDALPVENLEASSDPIQPLARSLTLNLKRTEPVGAAPTSTLVKVISSPSRFPGTDVGEWDSGLLPLLHGVNLAGYNLAAFQLEHDCFDPRSVVSYLVWRLVVRVIIPPTHSDNSSILALRWRRIRSINKQFLILAVSELEY
jgi:hypothetical protein